MAGLKRRTDFFEVNATPTLKKKRDSDPPAFLVLAPFALVPKISLSDVKIHTSAKTIIYLRNPTDKNIQIALDLVDGLQNIGVQLNSNSFDIPGNSNDTLEIAWIPTSVVQLRGKICVKHLNGDKKFSYISVVCSSISSQRKKALPKRLTNAKSREKINNNDKVKQKTVRFIEKFPECRSTNNLRRETYEVKEPKHCIPHTPSKFRNNLFPVNNSFQSLKEEEFDIQFSDHLILESSSPKLKNIDKKTGREPLKEFNLNIHLAEFQRNNILSEKERMERELSFDLSQLSFDRDSLDSPIQFSGNSSFFNLSAFKIRTLNSPIKTEECLEDLVEDKKIDINLTVKSEPSTDPKSNMTFSVVSLCSNSSFDESYYSIAATDNACKEEPVKAPQQSFFYEISPTKHLLKSLSLQKDVKSKCNGNKKIEKEKSPKRQEMYKAFPSRPILEGSTKGFYDEPDYLLHPYGMTAIQDPFSKYSIHCRDWLEKVELELIKWLNSLLRPPKELGSIVEGVDVMKLWDQSTASSLKLAPSRESACNEYVMSDGSHMFTLRKAASAFAQSNQIKTTIYNIRAKIQSGFLSVKDNISLHHNQGARVKLVQMIMYYNPLWLRIALEVIYDQVIPLHESNIHRGLVYFLKQNLLTSQHIIGKNKFPKSTHLKPEFTTEMNNFVILKFLTLVYFLDQAKIKRLVPYDPCLFCKNSPIKDSESMLNEFIKDFLKCVGHFKKTLRAIGFHLGYCQTHLDEFDYGLSTHLDLRDGVRLTRTMEIILKDPSYSQKLWTPAVSRIQKIHNVQVALSALANNGYTINEDIVATDIVNGHREKIYSLIWQILHKFLAPRYQTAAVKIQLWWRKYYVRVRKRREAATKIQKWYRKHLRRIELKKKSQAASVIQNWYRNILLIRYYERNRIKVKNAVLTIEKWYRNIKLCEKDRKAFLLQKISAIKIQQWYRLIAIGRIERQKFIVIRSSVITIQLTYKNYRKMVVCRNSYLKVKAAVRTIQKWYRGAILTRKLRAAYLLQINAINSLQLWWRMHLTRHDFLRKKKSAIAIQRWWRSKYMGKLDKELLNLHNAATIIQALWRGYKARYQTSKLLKEKLQKINTDVPKQKKQKKGLVLSQMFDNAVNFICHGSRRDLGNLAVAYNDIDVCTVFSPVLSKKLVNVEHFFEYMWDDLNQGFRDGLYLEIFTHCLNIILKIARFPETTSYLIQSMNMFDGYTILVTLMGKFIEKNTEIFCKAASVTWFLLITCPDEKLNKNFDFDKLRFYHKKILAKKNSRVEKYRYIPSLRPDWGYNNQSVSFLSKRTAIEEVFKEMS